MPVWAALLLYELQLRMHVVQLQGCTDELHCLTQVGVQLLLQVWLQHC
jgi:hypothetical protein